MNNAEFFNSEKEIVRAWNIRVSVSGSYGKGYDYSVGQMICYPKMPYSQFNYVFAAADTGFAYDVGEIVNIHGKYDIVDGYLFDHKTEVFYGIRLRNAGSLRIDTDKKYNYKADVPKEVVDLIRSQLQDKCPLKEAACR